MKALILAAGYATRLHPLTEDQPKPLLKVGGCPIIDYILQKIEEVPEVTEIYIVTNARFYSDFELWSQNRKALLKPIIIINDGTLTNDTRLGAVGDLQFVLDKEKINDELLVVAGDNLFGFSLADLVHFFKSQQATVVGFHNFVDRNKVKKKYGVGILEGTKIVDFEEKPENPRSALASTGCYLFTPEDLRLVSESIARGKADNPGDLIRWLVQHSEVHGFLFQEHWFDVGSFDSLREAEKVYSYEH